MKIQDIVSGKIDKLAFGGEGILRHNDLVLFVPFTAPQDTISCRIDKLKKNYGEASVVEILEQSPLRVSPSCAFFGTCGGCQLQHLKYEEQLKEKQQWVIDAFHRIGKLENVHVELVVPSPNEYIYRRHVSLSIRNVKNSCTAGYVGFNPKTFVEVTQCPIFIEKEESLLAELQTFVSTFQMTDDAAKVTILKDDESKFILHFHFRNLPKNAKSLMHNIDVKHPNWTGIIFSSVGKTLTFGKVTKSLEIDGLSFEFSSDVFMQNNPEQSLNITRQILKIAGKSAAKEILDLYCGIGISSLLLASRGIFVKGIEYNSQSIKMANQNAKANNLSNVHFICASVEDVLEKEKIPDFVIINPPREGLDAKVIEVLKKRLPERIIYVSCMPSTLARDLNLLGKENYTIEECQPYDMFPQTTHVETVVSLRRASKIHAE